mgnify:CR=1 FL=1
MTLLKSVLVVASFISFAVIPPSPPALAEANVPAIGDVDQCLPLNRIKRTKAVDNQTIVVEMKGKDGWRKIETSNRCPGLRIEDSFSYATSLT